CAELQLARRKLVDDLSEVRGVDDPSYLVIVGHIEEVKSLCADFERVMFAESETSGERRVNVEQPGPHQCIPAQYAELKCRRLGERLYIEPLLRGALAAG